MKEGADNKFIIEESEPVRCHWCGIPESDNWMMVLNGFYVCSDDCFWAINYSPNRNLTCSTTIIITFIVIGLPILIILNLGWFINIISGIVTIALAYVAWMPGPGEAIVKERPKGSRRYNIVVREKAIPLSCPKCGANLELGIERASAEYQCEYCGATGMIEYIIDKGSS